jgi:hypothetical protein
VASTTSTTSSFDGLVPLGLGNTMMDVCREVALSSVVETSNEGVTRSMP